MPYAASLQAPIALSVGTSLSADLGHLNQIEKTKVHSKASEEADAMVKTVSQNSLLVLLQSSATVGAPAHRPWNSPTASTTVTRVLHPQYLSGINDTHTTGTALTCSFSSEWRSFFHVGAS